MLPQRDNRRGDGYDRYEPPRIREFEEACRYCKTVIRNQKQVINKYNEIASCVGPVEGMCHLDIERKNLIGAENVNGRKGDERCP